MHEIAFKSVTKEEDEIFRCATVFDENTNLINFGLL